MFHRKRIDSQGQHVGAGRKQAEACMKHTNNAHELTKKLLVAFNAKKLNNSQNNTKTFNIQSHKCTSITIAVHIRS